MAKKSDELSRTIAFKDPISVVFDLNDEMRRRINPLRFIANYTYWIGVGIALFGSFAFILLVFFQPFSLLHSMLLTLILVSVVAAYLAHQQRPFLDEYQILAGAVARARGWEPRPRIPDGPDPIERFLRYLESRDERYAYFKGRRKGALTRSLQLQGESGKLHPFDAYFNSSSYPWDKMPESVRILVRAMPRIELEDVKSMKSDTEDFINRKAHFRDLAHPHMEARSGPWRVVLLQTVGDALAEEPIAYANENPLNYKRMLGTNNVDWTSPIELVTETSLGTYDFGTYYFG